MTGYVEGVPITTLTLPHLLSAGLGISGSLMGMSSAKDK
jgi:hypothetical protein